VRVRLKTTWWAVFLPIVLISRDNSFGAGAEDRDYVAKILAERKARDEEFRSRESSLLAGIVIAALDKPKTVIGSGPDADVRLPADGVEARHAELVRESGETDAPTFRIRPVDGKIVTDTEPSAPIEEKILPMRARVRIGRFVASWSNLGTFGPVVRVQDFTSPAFTQFDGLRYFPPDLAFRVEATVKPYAQPLRTTIGDTHGWRRPAWRYGEAAFTLAGRRLKLVLLLFTPEPKPEDNFFIAFTDQTRGKETYPAARYIETPFVRSGPMPLDFNRATNPFCAYNTGFACPLPPPENRLSVEIRAGEKLYPHAVGH
jgi:uncharacterized protein (DUF1684 family)